MKIVLDTSVIDRDLALEGHQARTVNANLDVIGGEIVLPSVVVDELLDHLEERMEDAIQAARRLPQTAADAVGVELSSESIALARTAVEARLRALATVAPYPNTPHQDIVSRMLSGRKPFATRQSQRDSRTKEKGYKDALIWSTVLDLVAEGSQVALVTGNKRDFADEDGQNLHPHLAEDLAGIGKPPSQVALYFSLQEFYEREIAPRLPPPDAGPSAWASGGRILSLQRALNQLIPSMLEDGYYDPAELGLPRFANPPYVADTWNYEGFKVLDVRIGSDGKTLVEFETTINAVIAYVLATEGPGISIIQTGDPFQNQDPPVVELLAHVRYLLSASASMDARGDKVLSAEINGFKLAES